MHFFHNQTLYTAHGVQRKKNKFFNICKICVLVLKVEKVIVCIENVIKTSLFRQQYFWMFND